MAEAKDCRLMEAATDEQRLSMLNEWAKTGKGYEHERDSRTRAARRQLSSENAHVDLPDTAAQDSASKSNNPAVSG